MKLPVDGRVTQNFYTEVNYIPGRSRHEALDIVTDGSQPIESPFNGIVVESIGHYGEGTKKGYGNEVIVESIDGTTRARFTHCHQDTPLAKGTVVSKGDQIAMTGRTGYRVPASVWHTHYELIKNGVRVDPANYHNYPQEDMTDEQKNQLQEVYDFVQAVKAGVGPFRQRRGDGKLFFDAKYHDETAKELEGRIYADTSALAALMRGAGEPQIDNEESEKPKYVEVKSARDLEK